MGRVSFIVRWAAVLFTAGALLACGGSGAGSPGVYHVKSETNSADLGYAPGPAAKVYDSARMEVRMKPGLDPGTDSLGFELLPAENGWSRAESAQLHKDKDGWYTGAFWMCPTVPGQFVTSWQTLPFTGFTFYLAARYDSSGALKDWSNVPTPKYPNAPLLVQDTMEVAYRYWPYVFSRRVHIVRRNDAPREFYFITESWERSRGISGRRLEYSANLEIRPQFPFRSRQWEAPGWVVDTISVWVRDTLVAWMAWTYSEFADNWEKNSTLFRDWEYKRQPELFFQVDDSVRLAHVWLSEPADVYIAARMYADTSQPTFDSLKRAFIYGPVPGAP